VLTEGKKECIKSRWRNGVAACRNGATISLEDESGRIVKVIGEYSADAEVLWNADGSAVAISATNGGVVSEWSVDTAIEMPNGEWLISRATSRDVKQAMKRQEPCGDEDANVGALVWKSAGNVLTVIAEVPPHSACGASMGMVKVFDVKAGGGEIEREYDSAASAECFAKHGGARAEGWSVLTLRKPS
jgi:hypothetical protein